MLAENFGKSIVSIQTLPNGVPYQSLNSNFNRSFYLIRSAHENRADVLKWHKHFAKIATQL